MPAVGGGGAGVDEAPRADGLRGEQRVLGALDVDLAQLAVGPAQAVVGEGEVDDGVGPAPDPLQPLAVAHVHTAVADLVQALGLGVPFARPDGGDRLDLLVALQQREECPADGAGRAC
jgi:hypothetical protein